MADLVENISQVNELIFGDLSVPQSRVEALLVQNVNAIKELADILEHIATIETDDTSTHHYEIGEYIIYDGRIYQTIKEINIGDTFEIDVNIKPVVFGDEMEGINDLLEAIKEMFGPVENGDKASNNYNIGDYIVYKNKLYRVTQNINNGGTFVENTNIVETNLNEIFKNILDIVPRVSTSSDGLMTAEDKIKLNSIETGANKYIHPAYTARTGVPTDNVKPGFGGTFNVSQPVSDALGHITSINSRTITIPSATATTTTSGLLSSTDKTKLDGISSANLVPSGGTSGQALKRDARGNLVWANDNDTTYSLVTTSANGLMSSTDKTKLDGISSANLVPSGGTNGQVLKRNASGNLVWANDNDTTYSTATTSANGLMSSADKSKLDGLSNFDISSYHLGYSDMKTNIQPVRAFYFKGGFTQSSAYYVNGFVYVNFVHTNTSGDDEVIGVLNGYDAYTTDAAVGVANVNGTILSIYLSTLNGSYANTPGRYTLKVSGWSTWLYGGNGFCVFPVKEGTIVRNYGSK